jgi:hypothetical protein
LILLLLNEDMASAQPKVKAFSLRPNARALLPKSEKTDFEEVKGDRAVVHPEMLAMARMTSASLGMGFAGYTPLPRRLKTQMKYVTNLLISGGVTPGLNVFSANGLYDPDVTGSGHQPRGFDQLIALYDHYVVTHSEIKVEFYFSSSGVPAVCGVQLQATSAAQSDYVDYAEQARCEFGLAPMLFGGSGGATHPRVHRLGCNVQQFMGIPDPITATKLQGSVSANPADQAFYHVFIQALDGSTSASITALVSLEYHAVFIEPVPVASS